MRLKTKLVVAATSVTFAVVVLLSMVFLWELLRQRIAQTAAQSDVMASQVLMMTRQAVESGVKANPPKDSSDEALQLAVADALRSHQPLHDTMDALVRYSPAVQDVSITDAHGLTLMSTDPTAWNQQAATRTNFDRIKDAGISYQIRQVFGPPRVLDATAPLDRNGMPFLTVHVGLRSTFLKNNYVPWLKDALLLALLGGLGTMVAAGFLANLALRPLEDVTRRLEFLTRHTPPRTPAFESGRPRDAIVRVTDTIDRLGEQMRSTEAGYTDLQANLNKMLDTLRDGVVLFTAEGRAVMVSDAVANFLPTDGPEVQSHSLVGRFLLDIFAEQTALGKAVLAAFATKSATGGASTRMEDGREVEVSLDRIDDGTGRGMGTLVTLRDLGSASRLEQELDVSLRLAAVGRLTAGVGHEVKNPINAMVVHLELLRGKLTTAGRGRAFLDPALRHVDVLADEMARLDRVVQTLADFTRPVELHPEQFDLADLVSAVFELTGADLAEHGVATRSDLNHVAVRADEGMLRQALLNLVLNGMQSMPTGGVLHIAVRRERDLAVIEVTDHGIGIAPESLPRIFDLYFTTKPTGSGIGLAMTYRIVQMHGGDIEVRSEPGRGSTFTVRLPLAGARSNRLGSAA